MPAKGAEYALLQKRYQYENILKNGSFISRTSKGARKIYTSI